VEYSPQVSKAGLIVMGQEANRCTIESGNVKKDENDVAFSASTSFRGGKRGVESLISHAIIATRKAI
jgi:hypothetical protein